MVYLNFVIAITKARPPSGTGALDILQHRDITTPLTAVPL